MAKAFICDFVRTPLGRYGGNLRDVRADDLASYRSQQKSAAVKQGLTPRARIVAMATAGVALRIMGMGPLSPTEKSLAKTGLTLTDIDIIELNETFAAQALAVTRQLGLADDDERVNPHGGPIAIGHPLGALNGLETRRAKRAIATMCIGVSQGIAVMIETV